MTQYVVVKLACALAAFILKPISLWDEGTLNPSRGYVWAALITNFSQCWALYCLVLFYFGLKKELKPLNPVGKFIAVKAIVFFSFWQSVAVALLVRLGIIADADIFPESSDSAFLAAATQDFLICIEMFVFACYHHRVFSYKEVGTQWPPLPAFIGAQVYVFASFKSIRQTPTEFPLAFAAIFTPVCCRFSRQFLVDDDMEEASVVQRVPSSEDAGDEQELPGDTPRASQNSFKNSLRAMMDLEEVNPKHLSS